MTFTRLFLFCFLASCASSLPGDAAFGDKGIEGYVRTSLAKDLTNFRTCQSQTPKKNQKPCGLLNSYANLEFNEKTFLAAMDVYTVQAVKNAQVTLLVATSENVVQQPAMLDLVVALAAAKGNKVSVNQGADSTGPLKRVDDGKKTVIFCVEGLLCSVSKQGKALGNAVVLDEQVLLAYVSQSFSNCPEPVSN